MAFSTEFVMGAGGAEVEEIPVSMSGGGNGTVYPLTTVDAGDGAFIVVTGTMSPANTGSSRPHLSIGSTTYVSPHEVLLGPKYGIGGPATGIVEISVLSRYALNTTAFNGTVYVARV